MLRVVSGDVFCHVILLQFLYSTMPMMQGNVKSWDVYILCMPAYLHQRRFQIAVFSYVPLEKPVGTNLC